MRLSLSVLFVLAAFCVAQLEDLDLFGMGSLAKSLGIKMPVAKYLKCKSNHIGRECARRMLSDEGVLGQQLAPFKPYMKAFKLDPDTLLEEVEFCKSKEGDMAEDMQEWFKLITQQNLIGFSNKLKQQCSDTICAELQKCEDTMQNMCDMMDLFSGNGFSSISTLNSILERLGKNIKEQGARDTAEEACQKIAELAADRKKQGNPMAIFQDFLGIGQRGLGSQVAGGLLSNAGSGGGLPFGGGAAGGANPLANLGNLAQGAKGLSALSSLGGGGGGGGGGLGGLFGGFGGRKK